MAVRLDDEGLCRTHMDGDQVEGDHHFGANADGFTRTPVVTRLPKHPAQLACDGRECIHLNCYLFYSGSGVRIPDGAQQVPLNSVFAGHGHFLLSGYVWASASFAKMDNSVTCGFSSGVAPFGDLTLNRKY